LTTGDNLYCERHKFKNEEILQDEAIIVEYESIEEAMRVIDKAKNLKDHKKDYFSNE
jgi:hypothetical protein